MRNLEISGAKRSIPEVAGSNPAPETELASVSANGTIRAFPTPQNRQNKQIDNKNKKGFAAQKLTVEDRKNLFYSILNEGVQP